MIITEAALRGQLRQPREGARVVVPAGASLSPSAADFVAQWRLELVSSERESAGAAAEWDRPSTFPVSHEGSSPRCVTCGGEVSAKPDALTQLNAYHFAPKTTPRIRLRGRIDTLQASTLLVAAQASASGHPQLHRHLATVAAYCRELLSAEYNERDAAPPALDERDEEAIHRATHHPRSELGVDHLSPGPTDSELLLRLNLLRCQVREVELVALETFDNPHHPFGPSIVHGLNRLSSVVYYLELQLQAAEGGPW